MTRLIDAVIFDLGGVLMRNGSPRDMAARFPDHPLEVVQRVIMGPHDEDTDHHWHRLERGEITLDEAREAGKQAMEAAGIRPGPPPAEAPPASSSAIGFEFLKNPEVIDLLHDVRAAGLKTGMLTNNVREFRAMWWPLAPWDELFDDIVDSHEVGIRKPNPAIYRLSLARLGVRAERAAFLDDMPANAAAASALGMHGILVDVDPAPAVAQVRTLAGLV